MVFILDKSGSMSGLEQDTVGGFNAMIEKQKNIEGQAIVSTVLFNHETNVLHDRINIKDLKPLNTHDYQVGGMTGLLDAVGSSIKHIRRIYADTLREERPNKVVFVITTDGMENASKHYTYQDIQSLIQKLKKDYDWEFIFLGANIDAIDEARKFGIHHSRAARYYADKEGTRKNYEAINEAVSSLRMSNTVNQEWKEKITKDYQEKKYYILGQN